MSTKKNEDSIYFFSTIDRKRGEADGIITSEYPAWMHDYQIEELKEEISSTERNIARYRKEGIFDSEQIFRQTKELDRKRAKLKLINESKPVLRAKDLDLIARSYKNLGNEIRQGLFTKSEMHLGSADPHEEADRMTNPIIDVNKCLSVDLAESLNIKVENGKISRTGAEKAWKILGHLLGEPTNTETLRKDRTTFRRGG